MNRSSRRVYLPLVGASLLLAGAVLAAPPPPPQGAVPTAGATLAPPPPPPTPSQQLAASIPYVAYGSFASNGATAVPGGRFNIQSSRRDLTGSYALGLDNARAGTVCTVSAGAGGPFGALCKGDMTSSAFNQFRVLCFAPGRVGNNMTGPMEPADVAFNVTCMGPSR